MVAWMNGNSIILMQSFICVSRRAKLTNHTNKMWDGNEREKKNDTAVTHDPTNM